MSPILSDTAASSDKDLLSFERYVVPLAKLLTNPSADTPFTIGIFGTWGSGKSTVLKMLEERLETQYAGKCVPVRFNPWLHRGEENMLVPLLHALQDTLSEQRWQQFKDSAAKIGTVLLRLAGDLLLKTMTVDAVSLERLEEFEAAYNTEVGRVSSEIRKLHSTLQAEARKIHERGSRLVFLIDDLDRCEPSEIIDVLEAIKLFLDLQHVFVVLAVDKEVIDRGIQVKYSEFEFAKAREISLGAEYLEKIIQLPLHLYPPSPEQVRRFIAGLRESTGDAEALLAALVLPNPRKIKRILNIMAITEQIKGATPALSHLKDDVLTRLTVLRVQDPELFAHTVAQPELLDALDGLYSAPQRYRLGSDGDWAQFKERREVIRDLSKTYFRPDTYLQALFRDSGIGALKVDEIRTYLSMIGS